MRIFICQLAHLGLVLQRVGLFVHADCQMDEELLERFLGDVVVTQVDGYEVLTFPNGICEVQNFVSQMHFRKI